MIFVRAYVSISTYVVRVLLRTMIFASSDGNTLVSSTRNGTDSMSSAMANAWTRVMIRVVTRVHRFVAQVV